MQELKAADKIRDVHTLEQYAVIEPEVTYKNGKTGARVRQLGGRNKTMVLSESKVDLCEAVN